MNYLAISNTFVVIMGLGIVFLGLICIILLCKGMGLICNLLASDTKKKPVQESMNSNRTVDSETIENRQEILAAVCAVVAEELGTDVNAIRVHSFRKI